MENEEMEMNIILTSAKKYVVIWRIQAEFARLKGLQQPWEFVDELRSCIAEEQTSRNLPPLCCPASTTPQAPQDPCPDDLQQDNPAAEEVLVGDKSLLQFKRVSVVLGNETCDLDSAISCVTYSLLLYKEAPTSIIIPVFNIPRNQLPVKTEVTYALRKYGINLDNIVFRDDIDLDKLHANGSLQLTLVDHHTLQPSDHQMISSVVAVVDHRPHDPAWPWPNADVTLKVVGSCCTLVAEKLLAQAPELVKPSVATLLLGTILLDTACLSPTGGRATSLDHQIVDRLQACCAGSINRQQLFLELQTAKSDISTLTTAQLIIKDLKFAAGIPIVGLPIKVKEFLQRPDASVAVQQFCEDNGAQLCVVYGMEVVRGALTRDIAVYSRTNTQAASQVVEALKDSQEPSLELQPQNTFVEGFMLFEQLNIKASRKQVLPVIRQVGEKLCQPKDL